MQENNFVLAGYLADKPQLRYLPSGTPGPKLPLRKRPSTPDKRQDKKDCR